MSKEEQVLDERSSLSGPLSIQEVRNALTGEHAWTDPSDLRALKCLHQHARENPSGDWSALERELFGCPNQYIDTNDEHGSGMSASLIDGPLTPFQKFSGLKLSDHARDALEDCSWQTLTDDVTDNLYEIGEFDEYPGTSDVFYWLVITDAFEFARSLREAIVEICQQS